MLQRLNSIYDRDNSGDDLYNEFKKSIKSFKKKNSEENIFIVLTLY